MTHRPVVLPHDFDAVPLPELIDLAFESLLHNARHVELLGTLARRMAPEPGETVHGESTELETISRLTCEIKDYDAAQDELLHLGLAKQTHTMRRERVAKLFTQRPDLARQFEARVVVKRIPWFKAGYRDEAT